MQSDSLFVWLVWHLKHPMLGRPLLLAWLASCAAAGQQKKPKLSLDDAPRCPARACPPLPNVDPSALGLGKSGCFHVHGARDTRGCAGPCTMKCLSCTAPRVFVRGGCERTCNKPTDACARPTMELPMCVCPYGQVAGKGEGGACAPKSSCEKPFARFAIPAPSQHVPPAPAPKVCPKGAFLGPEQAMSTTYLHAHVPCLSCPAGKFSATKDATSCAACPMGQFSAFSGSLRCGYCPMGKFQSYPGQDLCWVAINTMHKIASVSLDGGERSKSAIKAIRAMGVAKLLHTTSGETGENLAYKPRDAIGCCHKRCAALTQARDAAGQLLEDVRADCALGCHTWIAHSSLNWEAGRWVKKLHEKCKHDCGGMSTLQKGGVTGGGARERRRHGLRKLAHHFCEAGCDKYLQCL